MSLDPPQPHEQVFTVQHSMHAPPAQQAHSLDNSVTMDDHATLLASPSPAPVQTDAPPANNILAHLAVAETNININMMDIAAGVLNTPSFTPPPEGGFYPIHLSHSAQMFDHLDPNVINAWIAVPGDKLLARVFGYDGKDPISTAPVLAEHIKAAIVKIAFLHNLPAGGIRVSPPTLTKGKEHLGYPLSFLVHNVPTLVKGIVITRHVWSCPSITFEARDFDSLTLPTIFFALQGFTSDSVEDVQRIIFEAWARDETRAKLVEILAETDMTYQQIFPAVTAFVESVEAKLIEWKIQGGTPLPRYNVFATSPTTCPSAWTKIRTYLRSLTYSAPLEGTGYATAFVPCQICNSVDHPRGLCPFPLIPNWNGPALQARTRANTTRGRGRGRGGRGMHF
ncbi:hypothetical protein BJ138DRAFT_1098109 [Hygrophoropsis aurantiaca]|uniref:Uncharacterized protein n=1 Tax=Hygrophoropsis aurantiaca TaxID=72124 RepID=A0ACB8APD3_9AGAM|nr:hypothetical protein BJ138DRAFT_1098109 [Hygrophoropsis aurantiaca]